ncbi:Regulator of cytoskeleton and endocytosis [Colletotrichum sp. SAR 10_98]|nr:Regulator of cytoskeleton and endocytosis [Colletotrichum sp. SAR 10_98]
MQSMHRQFGKLMNKSPGDNAKIAAILHDYEDADNLLGKIIENTKQLRDSWVAVGTTQWAIVKEYEGLYDPIVGATEGHGRPSIATPQQQLDRTFKLREAYSDLKDELIEEVAAIDAQVIRPATEARDYLQPIRKTIKKRENKRLDYEKAEDKVKKLQKKTGRTPKEDAALSKAEFDMSCVSESGISAGNGSIAAGKKKPPPPPPAKRVQVPDDFVVAQYDFAGGPGDLSFREGDRIKIVKKTQTDQDWWIGELGGIKGSFPANYCKAA